MMGAMIITLRTFIVYIESMFNHMHFKYEYYCVLLRITITVRLLPHIHMYACMYTTHHQKRFLVRSARLFLNYAETYCNV